MTKNPALSFVQSILTVVSFSIFFVFFAFSNTVYAGVSCTTNGGTTTCHCYGELGQCFDTSLSNCENIAAPKNQCTDTWNFQYASSCQMCVSGDLSQPGFCNLSYTYSYNNCSTTDRCDTPTGTGQGSDYKVYAGICNQSYTGSDPNQACTSGGWYKSCCTGGETLSNPTPQGTCWVIPQKQDCNPGSPTAHDVTTCTIATPLPTSTPTPTPTPTPVPPPTTCPGNTTLTCGQGCTLFGTISGSQCYNISTATLCAPPTCVGGGGGGPPPPPPPPPPTPPPATPPPWGCTYTSYVCPTSCQGGGTYYATSYGQCLEHDCDNRCYCSVRQNGPPGCYDQNLNYCGQPTVSNHYCPTTNYPTWQYPWWEPNPPPQCGNTEWACYCPSWGLGYPIPISQDPACHSQPGDNSTCNPPSTSCSSQNNCYIGGGDGCSAGCTYQSTGPCTSWRTITRHGEDQDICTGYGPAGCYDTNLNYCGAQASFNGVTCTTKQNCLTTNCQPCTASSTSACQAPPTYTISGNVFVDLNGDGFKDNGEQNYTGGITITSTTGSVATSNGTFTASGVTGGGDTVSYTSLPAGYSMTFPVNGPPASFTVTVGPGICNIGGSTASCDSSGNISNLNFGIIPNKPWVQFQTNDVRVDAGFIDKISPAAVGGAYASIPGTGGTPGIIMTGGSSPDFGSGQASAQNWILGGLSYPETYSPTKVGGVIKMSYAFLSARATQGNITVQDLSSFCSGGLANCTLSGLSHGIYRANGDLTLNTYTFPSNGDFIILVNGNLTIKGRIKVPQGSTAFFSSSGNITVDKSLGEDPSSTSTTIEGVYSADKSFIADGTNNCTIGQDLRLNLGGNIITNAGLAGGSFVDNRDMCTQNGRYPTMQFQERPDFIINIPAFLKVPNYTYQEVAP